MGYKATRADIYREMIKLNLIGDSDGCVYFNEMLFNLLKRAYGFYKFLLFI